MFVLCAVAGVELLLFKLTQDKKYSDDFEKYMDTWLTRQRTPKGLSWYIEWGPLRYATNTAFLALLAADYGINTNAYRSWARSQVSQASACVWVGRDVCRQKGMAPRGPRR